MTGRAAGGEVIDIAVIGAGPCGLAVGVAAQQAGLRCVLFDRGAITQAMLDHPVYVTYFSGPEKLEIGGLPFTTSGDKPSRREALRYYRKVAEFYALDVRQYEDVAEVAREADGFALHTVGRGVERVHRARNVVVATGYYDNPRRLEIPGAELAKVKYYFDEPYPYWNQEVVVVGGGNSSSDAALLCWREGARVTLVHIFDAIDKGVKPWVRPDIVNRIEEGSIPALWRHRLVEIRPAEVVVENLETGERRTLPNDWVLAMTGYEPDPRMLRMLGVTIDPQSGVPVHDPATMETDVRGVFVAGVVVSGHDANKIFIENGKLHGPLIAAAVAEKYGAS
ncbi:MAG: Thioredoxin reductase [uncultured Gemmatimonadetes bacterium]|uniref:Thioredoxin reductase n=1 Tax=uncultured Gemmatimonadota bacterium TaxID=203437 RepID=A0A6J4M5F1_9BACT|nr:MAG: Thioredoxin reductase [uncultured Gemmatimonadota bacterium]